MHLTSAVPPAQDRKLRWSILDFGTGLRFEKKSEILKMRPVLHQQHLASAEDQALRLEVVGALLMLLVNISLICKICLSVVYFLGLIILELGIEQMAASVEILLSLLVVVVVFKVQLCS